MSPLLRHIAGSLLFGFSSVFAFAIFVQAMTDFINWIYGPQIRFMFPRGFAYAFSDIELLISILTSLVFTALVVSAVFFVVKARRRRGVFDWDEDPGQDG